MPWANQTLHDSIIFRDNDFEIFINANGDNYNYNEIEINALGKVWDLFLPSPYRDMGKLHTAPLMNWETIAPSQPTESQLPTGWTPMQQAIWMNGTINNGTVPSVGWGLEVALPWTIIAQASESGSEIHPLPREPPFTLLTSLQSLFIIKNPVSFIEQTALTQTGMAPKPGAQWRINFSRCQWNVTWDPATQQYVKQDPVGGELDWVWSPQWQVQMHLPELWGYMQVRHGQSAFDIIISFDRHTFNTLKWQKVSCTPKPASSSSVKHASLRRSLSSVQWH